MTVKSPHTGTTEKGQAMATQTQSRTAKRGWPLKRMLGALLLSLIPLAGLGIATASPAAAVENSAATTAAPQVRQATDDEDLRFQFYNVASGVTGFFSSIHDPKSGLERGSDKVNGSWNSIMDNPGSAGALLGYVDPDFTLDRGWLSSKLSGASDGRGYDSVRGAGDSLSGATSYGLFGATLAGLGLDSTATGLMSAGVGMMNWISGAIVLALYVLSGLVDMTFSAFIGLLSMLNPFRLFYEGVAGLTDGGDLADSMVGGQGPLAGPLQGLSSFVGGWYQIINSISWTVMVPLFLVTMVLSLLMLQRGSRGGAVKRFIVRLLFIALGLPLLGSMYTGVLSSLDEGFSASKSGATRVVLSTYVDFGAWAYKSRLAVPEGATIEWNTSTNEPSMLSAANVRNTALAINGQSYGGLRLDPIVSAKNETDSWRAHMQSTADPTKSNAASYMIAMTMLVKFMQSDTVSSTTVEDELRGDLTKTGVSKDSIADWFESLQQKPEDMAADKEGKVSSNPLIAVAPGTGLQAVENGSTVTFTSNSDGCRADGLKMQGGALRSCNLSPVAMYNYLNTSFGSDSMTVYSPKNAGSESTRSFHMAVNLVGTGMMSFLYWLNSVVVLGSFVIIGFGYAFSMLFASIRRSFQVITTVPFATMGAIAAIAKLIVYVVALVLETLGTVFVYKLVQMFLESLPQIVETALQSMLKFPLFSQLTNGGWNFGLIAVIISIISLVIFTVMAMRLRKTLLKAAQEAVTKLTEKFLESPVGTGGSNGTMVPALAGGLAGGAGMAAANRMMNSNGTKGPAAGEAADQKGGPAGVQTSADQTTEASGSQGELEAGQVGPDAGAPGNGDPGAAPDSSDVDVNVDSASADVELGRDVEANGLSEPGEGGATRDPRVGDDAMSSASETMEKSTEGYKEADKERLDGGVKGVKAVGHAGVAVAKGYSGDAAGAAESGGRAVEQGGAAVASNERAKQKEEDAGRSSLDQPRRVHAERAGRAEQVSRAGGTVANTAGTMSSTSGGGKGPQGLRSGAAQTPAPKPAAAPAQPAPRAPQSRRQPAQATPQAPQPKQAPKPQRQGGLQAPTTKRGPRVSGPAKP